MDDATDAGTGPESDPVAAAGRRPPGVRDDVVAALGKASEALEYLERARGHLYSLHQLIGHADLLLEEAADGLEAAGLGDDATMVRVELVGRNVLDGRWTFQIVEEFEDCYWRPIGDAVRGLEARHLDGQRHVFEAELKEQRRSRGRRGHERRPPTTAGPD